MLQKMNFGHVAVLLLTYATVLVTGYPQGVKESELPQKFDLWSDADPLVAQDPNDVDKSSGEEAERWCEGETACNKTCPLLGYKTGHDGECLMCTCRHSGIFEGDILVKETQYNSLLELYGKTETPIRTKRAAHKKDYHQWPAGADGLVKIPYIFHESLDDAIRPTLMNAIERFNNKTCIRFVMRTGERTYVRIANNGSCWAHTGYWSGEQDLSLAPSCSSIGGIMHELMHVIGFWHEQSRPDRDNYVKVMFANIKTGFRRNYEKMSKWIWRHYGSPYDYNSLMHYGGYDYAKNTRWPTLINAKTLKPIARHPQRDGFSAQDLIQINRKYNNCTLASASNSRLRGLTTTPSISRTTTPATTTATTTTPEPPPVAPYSGACGVTSSRLQYDLPQQNIVGGITSTYGTIPWQVAVFTMCRNRNFCGATLISNQHILTTAVCLGVTDDPDDFYVMLGRTSREFHKNDVGQVTRLILSITAHEDYDKSTFSNDISIVKLKEPVEFTNYIRPVCLPSPGDGEITRGTKALVSGWGNTQDGTTRNDHLQQVDVTVIGSWICNKWMAAKGRAVNSETMLCAGYKKGKKDTCSGDIGAPLVIKKGRANVLVGINSWGFGCANVESPSVFTKVSNYLTWIRRNSV